MTFIAGKKGRPNVATRPSILIEYSGYQRPEWMMGPRISTEYQGHAGGSNCSLVHFFITFQDWALSPVSQRAESEAGETVGGRGSSPVNRWLQEYLHGRATVRRSSLREVGGEGGGEQVESGK